ncbi:MAG: hypothetical protein AB7E81_05745 [Hyphomicrobiaceae bacterium]
MNFNAQLGFTMPKVCCGLPTVLHACVQPFNLGTKTVGLSDCNFQLAKARAFAVVAIDCFSPRFHIEVDLALHSLNI